MEEELEHIGHGRYVVNEKPDEHPIVEQAHWNVASDTKAQCSNCLHHITVKPGLSMWPAYCPSCNIMMMGAIKPPINVRR